MKKRLLSLLVPVLLVTALALPSLLRGHAELLSIYKFQGNDTAASDLFGDRVAIDGSYAIVGGDGNDDNGSGSGSAYIFKETGGVWSEIVELHANDAASGDTFGQSVSINGTTAVVGAVGNDDGGTSNTGSVYIFYKDNGGVDAWGEEIEIQASAVQDNAQFGWDVDVDGDFVLVGAPFEDHSSETDNGAAYIFERNLGGADNWGERVRIVSGDADTDDRFGTSVDLDATNGRAIVGAEDDNNNEGAAYIFDKDNPVADSWGETKKLTNSLASGGFIGDSFGYSVSIDGDIAVAGAISEEIIGVYYKDEGGVDNWGEFTNLIQANSDGLGISVEISGDVIVAGARLDDDGGPPGFNTNEGAVYEFHKDLGGADNWGRIAKYIDPLAGESALLGIDVGFDGTTIIGGAGRDDEFGSLAGAAYIFEPADFTPPNEPTGLTNEIVGAEEAFVSWTDNSGDEDEFNIYFSQTNDFHYYQAGSDGTEAADETGHHFTLLTPSTTYYYWITSENTGGESYPTETGTFTTGQNPQNTDYLVPTDIASGDFAGFTVDVDGNYAVVSAPNEDGHSDGEDEGSVYIFQDGVEGWRQIKQLGAPVPSDFEYFGNTADISGDYVLITTFDNSEAYIFEKDFGGSNNWGLRATLDTTAVVSEDIYGDIDGDYAVIGDPDFGGSNQGALHFYYKDEGGADNWGLQDTAQAATPTVADYLGLSVTIDGIYAGASNDPLEGESVFVFKRTGSTWAEVDELNSGSCPNDTYFGTNIGISGDYLVTGCPGADYVFMYKRDTPLDTWSELFSLQNTGSGREFGRGVAIEGDDAFFTFSLTNTETPGPSANEVFHYQRVAGTDDWVKFQDIGPYALNHPSIGAPGPGFFDNGYGDDIAFDGDQLIVGSDDITIGGMGMVYHLDTPQPPIDLVASQASSTSVQLDWDDYAINETGYKVYDNTNSNITEASVVTIPTVDLETHTVTGLATNETHYFWVAATNGAGDSTTRELSFTLEDPASPTNFATSDVGETTIDVEWTDNADNETGYRVYINTVDVLPGAPEATLAANSDTYQFTGLTSGQEYFMWVSAFNGSGENFATPNISATPSNLVFFTQKEVPSFPGFIDAMGLKVAISNTLAVHVTNNPILEVFNLNGSGEWVDLIGTFLGDDASDVTTDGDYVAVGHNTYTSGPFIGIGKVDVYKVDAEFPPSVTLVDTLLPSIPESGAQFGVRVVMSGDYLVVAANGSMGNTGNLEVFKRDTGLDTWSSVDILITSDGAGFDNLGQNALDFDGTTIVSALSERFSNRGAVYVFEPSGADDWSEAEIILPGDIVEDDFYGEFGLAVQGDYVFIGYDDEAGGGSGVGAVDVFKSNGAGDYTEVAKITQADHDDDRFFGDYFDKSIQAAGDYFAVAFELTAGFTSYSYVDLYQKDTGADSWSFQSRLSPDPDDWWCWTGIQTQSCDEYYIYDLGMSDNFIMYGAPEDAETGQDEGALWFYNYNATAMSSVVGDGGGGSSTCSDHSVEINLDPELPVYKIGDETVVELDWGSTISDRIGSNLLTKTKILFNYLSGEPEVGSTGLGLRNLFARVLFDSISEGSLELREAFDEALAETIQDTDILEARGIKNLFRDYFPYIFAYELRQNDDLADAFLKGVDQGINTNDFTLGKLSKEVTDELRSVSGNSHPAGVVSCMLGQSGGSDFKDFLLKAQNNDELMAAIDALENDGNFFTGTENAVNIGINSLLLSWKGNSSVQALIELFETDPAIRDLIGDFYKTDLGEKFEECVKHEYKLDLLEVAKEVYVEMVKPMLAQGAVCDDDSADVMVEAVPRLLAPTQSSNVKNEAGSKVLNFINDYIQAEAELGGDTPFADQYRNRLSLMFDIAFNRVTEIYRDNNLIARIDNPSVTNYIDTNVPENTSGKVRYHLYHIVTRTGCDSATGGRSRAQIDPELEVGSPVDTTANIQVRVKDSHSEFFMNRLERLLNGIQQGDDELNTADGLAPTVGLSCSQAKSELLEKRRGDNVFDYVLACFGDNQINNKLKNHRKDIVLPLMRLFSLDSFANIDTTAEHFLDPILVRLQEDYEVKQEILSQVGHLGQHADVLLQVPNINSFTDAQKELIKCGGHPACPEDLQDLIWRYFRDASHSVDFSVEIYQENGNFLRSKVGRADIFGELKGLEMGIIRAHEPYEFKIRMANAPYTLPKAHIVEITNAEPAGHGLFLADIDLINHTPFRYGNFDNSDDEINLNDIDEWSQLIQFDPEKWEEINVDGFTGLDLFDAILLQGNWGQQLQDILEDSDLTLQDIIDEFDTLCAI